MDDRLVYLLAIFGLAKEEERTLVSVGYNIKIVDDHKELTLIPRRVSEWRMVLRGIPVPLHDYYGDGQGSRTRSFLYNCSLPDEEILYDGLENIAPEVCDMIEGRFVLTDEVASETIYEGIDQAVADVVWDKWGTPEFAREYEKIKPYEVMVPRAKPIPLEAKAHFKKRLEELLKRK